MSRYTLTHTHTMEKIVFEATSQRLKRSSVKMLHKIAAGHSEKYCFHFRQRKLRIWTTE